VRLFAIGDLHLSFSVDKPMDVFGYHWKNHHEKIEKSWENSITEDDLVLIPGDISWAMNFSEAKKDFEWIHSLPGTKIITKGNHDYWWESLKKLRESLPDSIIPIQNNAVKTGGYIIAGTRGWLTPEFDDYSAAEDEKAYQRELGRLKLSLEAAEKIRGDEKLIVMLHYPPLISGKPTEFAELIVQYGADACVYGHLHNSPGEWEDNLHIEYGGVRSYLVSADYLDFSPLELKLEQA